MRISKKTLSLLAILVVVGFIFVIGVASQHARISRSAASPEIDRTGKETSAELVAEDLVISPPELYFPENK